MLRLRTAVVLTCSNAPDDDDLGCGTDCYVIIHSKETSIELHHSQTQTGTHTKHGADHRQGVYEISPPSVDSLSCRKCKKVESLTAKPMPMYISIEGAMFRIKTKTGRLTPSLLCITAAVSSCQIAHNSPTMPPGQIIHRV